MASKQTEDVVVTTEVIQYRKKSETNTPNVPHSCEADMKAVDQPLDLHKELSLNYPSNSENQHGDQYRSTSPQPTHQDLRHHSRNRQRSTSIGSMSQCHLATRNRHYRSRSQGAQVENSEQSRNIMSLLCAGYLGDSDSDVFHEHFQSLQNVYQFAHSRQFGLLQNMQLQNRGILRQCFSDVKVSGNLTCKPSTPPSPCSGLLKRLCKKRQEASNENYGGTPNIQDCIACDNNIKSAQEPTEFPSNSLRKPTSTSSNTKGAAGKVQDSDASEMTKNMSRCRKKPCKISKQTSNSSKSTKRNSPSKSSTKNPKPTFGIPSIMPPKWPVRQQRGELSLRVKEKQAAATSVAAFVNSKKPPPALAKRITSTPGSVYCQSPSTMASKKCTMTKRRSPRSSPTRKTNPKCVDDCLGTIPNQCNESEDVQGQQATTYDVQKQISFGQWGITTTESNASCQRMCDLVEFNPKSGYLFQTLGTKFDTMFDLESQDETKLNVCRGDRYPNDQHIVNETSSILLNDIDTEIDVLAPKLPSLRRDQHNRDSIINGQKDGKSHDHLSPTHKGLLTNSKRDSQFISVSPWEAISLPYLELREGRWRKSTSYNVCYSNSQDCQEEMEENRQERVTTFSDMQQKPSKAPVHESWIKRRDKSPTTATKVQDTSKFQYTNGWERPRLARRCSIVMGLSPAPPSQAIACKKSKTTVGSPANKQYPRVQDLDSRQPTKFSRNFGSELMTVINPPFRYVWFAKVLLPCSILYVLLLCFFWFAQS